MASRHVETGIAFITQRYAIVQRLKQYVRHLHRQEVEVAQSEELCTTAQVERTTETPGTLMRLLLLLTPQHLHQNSASQTTRLASIDHRLTIIDQVLLMQCCN